MISVLVLGFLSADLAALVFVSVLAASRRGRPPTSVGRL
jgi:hypothetical protein